MARRRKYSRTLISILGIALLVAATVGVYKLLAGRGEEHPQVAANNWEANAAAAQPRTEMKLAAAETVRTPGAVSTPTTQPLRLSQPTTKPAPLGSPTRLGDTAARPAEPTPAKPAEAANPALTNNAAPSALITEAEAKKKADDLVAARKLLLTALDSSKTSPAEKDDLIRRISEINETVVFSNRKFLSDEYEIQHTVKPGENLQKIANQYDLTYKFIQRINGNIDERRLQAGKSLKIIKGPFHALVNKKTFTMDIYMGKPPGEPGAVFVRRFRVGTGASDSTPTGVWTIGVKQVNPSYTNPRNEGPHVIAADDPKNPLGERWMALEGASGQAVGKTSYGIHGTIDPDSIGQQKSMGCIRMLNEDVELVYDMLITGKSTVTVVE